MSEQQRRPSGDPAPRGAEVLVVEDDSVLALALAEALDEAGLSVVGPCLSYRQALAVIARSRPRHAVLDIDLGTGNLQPGWEGERLLAILVEAGCHCVVYSGHAELFERIRRYFPQVTLIAKPVPVERVAEAIRVNEAA